MTALSPKIIEPVNNAAYVGTPTVTFRGTVSNLPESLTTTALFYRWYSSLNPKVGKDNYAMNTPTVTDAGTTFSIPLNLGSHVITLAVSDATGEALPDLQAIKHGGVTGGSDGDARCVIHVFKAHLIAPTSGPIHKDNCTLKAEAPLAWGQAIPHSDPVTFEINPQYAKVNRLQYRWEYIPNIAAGSADQRQTINFMPSVDQYTITQDPPNDDHALMTLVYTGPLPADLNGNYRLILHVEDTLGVLGGDEASVSSLDIA